MSDPQTLIEEIKSSPPKDLPSLNDSERQQLQHYIKNKSYSQSEPVDINKLDINRNKYKYDREFIVKLYRYEGLSKEQAAHILDIKPYKFDKIRRDYIIYTNDGQYLEKLSN